MKIRAAFFSNTGMVRTRNEDGLLLDRQMIAGTSMSSPVYTEVPGTSHILVVSDGLGGHAGGQTATKAVLETFKRNGNRLVHDRSLLNVIGSCKTALNRIVRNGRGLLGLGATTAGIVIGNGHGITVFNCGDCRVYRLSGGDFKRITRDHSFVQQLFEQGEITEEAMKFHARKNLVTSALVGDLDRKVPEFFSRKVPVSRGDRFLICSDGVWESMDTAELAGIIGGDTVQKAANVLVRKVMENGASDNYTFIIAEIQ